jgi:peptidoglycan/xylan/chitin deacetylase (PgdA/CDA1 family)
MIRGTAVLMYHAFGHEGEPPSRYVLPADRFAAQMRMLRRLRFRVIGLEEHVRRLESRTLAPRTAVITIDDGYRDNHEIAHPVLRRFGYPATLFVVSGRVGAVNDWDREGDVAGRPLLNAHQLRELAAAGVTIGAHTRNHPSLPSVDELTTEAEVAGSKADLEAELGSPVGLFAYPYGRHDAKSVSAVRAAGFRAACSTRPGLSRAGGDPFLIERIEVRGDDSMGRFVAGLLGWARSRP